MSISKRYAGQYRIIGELKLHKTSVLLSKEKTTKITYRPKSKISLLKCYGNQCKAMRIIEKKSKALKYKGS